MDKQFDCANLSKCIEVKGMNSLSLPYIQRFFGHVGPVEQAKKIQDLVLVRFKNQSSVNKALRFSGRVIDKQPIKIRSASTLINPEQSKIKRKPSNLKYQIEMYQKLDEVIKNRVFDITFYWVNILKIINKLQDDRNTWLLHEIFFIKLSQIIHFHAFGTNPRSCFSEISIKENFLQSSKNNIKLTRSQGNIEKLQILSIPSNELLDQANYECFLSNVDTKLRQRFNQLLKNEESSRLYKLYQIMNSYSIHIPADESIFSTTESSVSNNQLSISKQLVTKNCARISFQDPREQKRSEYRQIDKNHPNKEIEILSDSCLNQKVFEYTTYDVFRDDFDGSINNNCAVDVFFHLKIHFAANYIIIRYRQLGKMHYFRLDFQLRLLNCEEEVLGGQNFAQYFQYQANEVLQVPEIKLMRHSLVICDFENTEKTLYLIEHYVRFFLPESSMKLQSEETDLLVIMAILTNPSTQGDLHLLQIQKKMQENEIIRRVRPKLYGIKISSLEKFEKQKCKNFVEEYMEQHKNPYNLQISKLHARRIMDENPSKFKHIPNIQQFITQSLWKFQQQKSKKQAKNRVKAQLQSIRMG